MRAAVALAALVLLGAAPKAKPKKEKPAAGPPIAVTSRMDGSISILDRSSLALLRSIPGTVSTWPMLSVADPARECLYVGNVGTSLAKISYAKGAAPDAPPVTLDLGGAVAGLAISPDGKTLAVNGVKDLTLRLVDLDAWKEVTRVSFGEANVEPKHKPLTYGAASPHPVWLADGSAVVTQDNFREEIVLVAKDGTVKARRPTRTATHTVLQAQDGSLLAIVEGDGDTKAQIAVLKPDTLEVIREIDVPLADGEAPKLHHGALSPDGELLVVANMGPVAAASGFSAVAVKWKTGEIAWSVPTVRTAGHVAFLDAKRVLVSGHRTAEMKVLSTADGKTLETWEVMGTPALGHALEVEPGGTVLVLDATLGRVMRFKKGELAAESERVGDGYAEASLAE